jgi:hypothetical protein
VIRGVLRFAIIIALVFDTSDYAAAAARPNMLDASYRMVFSDEFNDPSSVREHADDRSSAKWYRSRFFGEASTPVQMLRFNAGVITLVGTDIQAAQIQTAAPFSNAAGWKGRVFRNGAYFEARIAIGDNRLATKQAWPAFWSMAIEHMPQRGAAQWIGQKPGYMRFIENDFFEFNPAWSLSDYYATMWEWYGEWELCNRNRWCEQSTSNDPKRAIRLPGAQNTQAFHVYGQRWVPARKGSLGYVQQYLNGKPVGQRVSWRVGDPTPPTVGLMKFNVIDRQGLLVILTTGGQPMRVDWVRIWQPPGGRVELR